MDFTLDPKSEAKRQAVRAFVNDRLIPLEADRANYDEHENISPALLKALRAEVKAAGLWCLQLPEEIGGQGLPFTGMAACYEEMNRSIFGPVCFNSAAPDDGNMMVMNKVARQDQKDWWMMPVVRGEVQSSFA
ncbi:MAG: Butyryl-CoA dehydrogenase, partial [Rubritepida sp.]|nr:Butyryl-CoA dehydrogenase [Rubritepida sp.]